LYFIFREDYTTRELFENGKLKNKLRIKMGEITKSCRKLGNEELPSLDFPPSVIRLIRTKS
jgi:hypothetical protein